MTDKVNNIEQCSTDEQNNNTERGSTDDGNNNNAQVEQNELNDSLGNLSLHSEKRDDETNAIDVAQILQRLSQGKNFCFFIRQNRFF